MNINMGKTIFRAKFFDMPYSVSRSTQISFGVMVILCAMLAGFLTDLTPLDALIAGIITTFIYYFSEVVHQYGHFFAAKQTGKPSTGLRLWFILGTTLYPSNEGQVKPSIHMRRAIGGPIASLILLIIFLFLGSFLWAFSDMARFIVGWGIFVNSVWYIGGALIPMQYKNFTTDGMTIWKAWRDQQ